METTIQGKIVRETEKAIQVDSMNFYRQLDPQNTFQWFPKSQITITRYENGNCDITMPFWLAKQKGLV